MPSDILNSIDQKEFHFDESTKYTGKIHLNEGYCQLDAYEGTISGLVSLGFSEGTFANFNEDGYVKINDIKIEKIN